MACFVCWGSLAQDAPPADPPPVPTEAPAQEPAPQPSAETPAAVPPADIPAETPAPEELSAAAPAPAPVAPLESLPSPEETPAPAAVDFTGLLTFTRTWEQQFPAAEPPRIDVSHKHGPLLVRVWDQPLVRATATMTVGALDQAVAQQFADAIIVQAEQEGPRLLFVSTYPSGDGTPAIGAYTMELSLDVPRASSLSVRNEFGDTN
ncbi:MAG: hypothetical protein AAB353_00605, partial [Candidatus Hydrogenedentota bacterium]